MILCDYGCGQKATHQFKNGKWCCSNKWLRCPNQKKRFVGENNPFYNCQHNNRTKEILSRSKSEAHKRKISESKKGIAIHTIESKRKISKAFKGPNHPLYGKHPSYNTRKKISRSNKNTIKKIKSRHPLFSKIEEMRYNPDKPGKKEIQVHCKNHNCPNSKEQGGWFTPTYTQVYERIRQIEKSEGGCYFYCCNECKIECPLFNLQSDPFKINNINYTQSEYQIFRNFVLERDNYKCQYCSEKAEHVHHERPQKLEPFFTLDPDLAWSVCKKCHYKKGHKDECSTSNLSKITCYG